jgi:cytochrome c oxidase assembly factor CtaG
MPVTLSVSLLIAAYAIGLLRFRRHAGGNRGPSMIRVVAMAAGLLVIELALASRLDDLADHLLSAHMTQHLLLMLIAAPLLVSARPLPYLVWGLPTPLRRILARLWNPMGLSGFCRVIRAPALCWIGFCATVILWHIPALYRWAIRDEFRHALMHMSFLGAALLFWSVVIVPTHRQRLNYASAGLYVFSAALLTGLPGALITFARRPLYIEAPYGSLPFGLTALTDQQLAGLIMWIPMDLILFGAALALFGAGLSHNRLTGSEGRRVDDSAFGIGGKKARSA